MLHCKHTIDIQPDPAVLVAALVGCVVGAVASIAVTRRRHSRQLAAALADALHDPLTGLPNRRAAMAEVNRRLTDARPFLLGLLDLDDFKTVNDTYGHPTGDDVLTVVGARLHVAVAPDGFVARLGGDEFLLLLRDHGGDPAATIAPMLAVLAQPVRIGAATLRPRARGGVATSASGGVAWRDLISHADRALYRAKASQDDVAVYNPHLDAAGTDDDPQRPRIRRRDPRPSQPADGDTAEPGA